MSVLDPWRQALRPMIPKGFLRRDQGDGLFVSDYPRYGEADAIAARMEAAGFHASLSPGLARIVPTLENCAALLDAAPCREPAVTDETLFLHSLARRIAGTGAPLTRETEQAVWSALKFLDAGDLRGLYRFLSPAAALAPRKHHPLPAALGRMLLYFLYEPG